MKRDPALKADRFITVAADLFYRKGFRAVGIDEIVKDSGMTKPTLYRKFGSKDNLGAACLTKLATEDRARFERIAQQHDDDPIAQIRAIVADAAKRIDDCAYRGWPMSNAEIEITDPEHPARVVCHQYKTWMQGHLDSLSRQAGFERPTEFAAGLLLLIEGAAASWHSLGATGPSAHLASTCEILIVAHQRRASFGC